jgi:hypothetical protein
MAGGQNMDTFEASVTVFFELGKKTHNLLFQLDSLERNIISGTD